MLSQLKQIKRQKAQQSKIKAKGWIVCEDKKSKSINDTFEAPPLEDELEEENDEEIPIDCRLKMRNFGIKTKTSSGPNSYGKQDGVGFVDPRAYNLNQKKIMEEYFYQQDKKEIDLCQEYLRHQKAEKYKLKEPQIDRVTAGKIENLTSSKNVGKIEKGKDYNDYRDEVEEQDLFQSPYEK